MAKNNETFNLETALNELEKIVVEMENKDTNLDKALTLFEKGIGLSRQCQNALEKAEQKIQILQQTHGNETLTDFLPEEEK